MNMAVDISEWGWVEAIREWYDTSPSAGYVIVLGLLAFWLIGVLANWKWTYQPGTWLGRYMAELFGAGTLRLATALLLLLAIGCTLFFWLK